MADAGTVDIDCHDCGETLHVPLTTSPPAESTTPGHVIVYLQADHAFLAAHRATHQA